MPDVLIAPDGGLASVGDPSVGRRLGLSAPVESIFTIAVRENGWVQLRRGRHTVRITLGLEPISKAALYRLIRLLLESGNSRILIQKPWTDRAVEVFDELDDAVARLRVGSALDRAFPFNADPLSLDHIEATPVTRRGFHEVFSLWRSLRGTMTDEMVHQLDRPGLGTTIARYSRQAGMTRLIVESFGTHAGFLPEWRQAAIGNDFERQPDELVGHLSAIGCHEFRGSDTPSLELVDARIRFPGVLPQQHRLQRLLLPWRRGADQLFSVSTLYRFVVTVGASERVQVSRIGALDGNYLQTS